MSRLLDIEGIGEAYAQKLKEAGIASQEEFLRVGGSPQGRKIIARDAGIDGKLILEWVNRVDLARIRGVGGQWADLLEAAGVDSCPELAKRVPKNLYEKVVAVNSEKKLVRQLPSQKQVAGWVAQAKALPRAVTH